MGPRQTVITVFSTPKPFTGHTNIIQRNAIQSWQRLHPDVEVMLIGDDEGTAEVCEELRITHIKEVRRNEYGTKYLASVYEQAEDHAGHEILCHVNCDIVLMSDFLHAVKLVSKFTTRFLMAGQRWDVNLDVPLHFHKPEWENDLRRFTLEMKKQRPPQWIDYFVFTKGLYRGKIPEFLIGRPGWDNWLVWYPLSIHLPVIDASRKVVAVHQNHDYSYHPDGERGVWQGVEAQWNYGLLDIKGAHRTLESASYVIDDGRIRKNYRAPVVAIARSLVVVFYSLWFPLLDVTRPVRILLGLRPAESDRRNHPIQLPRILVVLGVAALLLWWIWSIVKLGDIPPGRGW